MAGQKRKRSKIEIAIETTESGFAPSVLQVHWLVLLFGFCVVSAFFLPTESAVDSGSDFLRITLIMGLGAAVLWWHGSNGRFGRRSASIAGFNLIDACVFCFLLAHTSSSLFGIFGQSCEPRPAVNMMWQQLSFGVLYAMARLIMQHSLPIRIWLRIVVAGGMVVVVYAWYQFSVELPGLHRNYLAASPDDKLQMLLQAGVSDPSPDSRMRQLFESRLFNREPFAFFTLANSLAGLLVPLILMSFAMVWDSISNRRWAAGSVWGFAWLSMAATLVLTSSRTGILTVSLLMAGYVVWQLTHSQLSRRIGTLLAVAVLALPVVFAIALWLIGASDSRLITSAPATLRYRLEYWIASGQMIYDFPVFGCGPGSFQSCYAKYQLPSASETVSDPHNFVIEWMATAGLPTGLFMLIAITVIGLYIVRVGEKNVMAVLSKQESSTGNTSIVLSSRALFKFVAAGSVAVCFAVVAGLVSGWLFGYSPTGLMAILVGLVVAVAWLWAAVFVDNENVEMSGPAAGCLLAWLGLMVHLLASGGINYPAIGQLFFVCMAVVVNRLNLPKFVLAGKYLQPVASGSLLVAAFYVYYFQLSPLVKSSAMMSRLGESRQLGGSDRLLTQVLKIDPYNSQAAFELAFYRLQESLPRLDEPQVQKQTQERLQAALNLEPYSSPACVAVGQQYLSLVDFEANADNRVNVKTYFKRQAADWLEEASERKPIDSQVLVLRSWLQWELNNGQAAVALADHALVLNENVPHEDLKLEQASFSVPTSAVSRLEQAKIPLSSQTNKVDCMTWCEWLTSQESPNDVAPK